MVSFRIFRPFITKHFENLPIKTSKNAYLIVNETLKIHFKSFCKYKYDIFSLCSNKKMIVTININN